MVSRGGRCLCSLLILTGFLLGATNGQNNIKECLSNPCMNGGNCIDLVNGYTCLCLEGFNGTRCEFDFRECESTPCQNGGNCSDGPNYYNCACAPGFNGIYCENKCPESTFGDYCTESCTCVDGANCSNVDGNCTCDPAFEGAVCDRSEVKVTGSRTSNDAISEGDDFTLACQVNLIGNDLDEVAWYKDGDKLPGTTDEDYRVDSNTTMGMYDITILGANALDTGDYHCTAVTKGNRFNASSQAISVDVVVPGQIDLGLSKLKDYIQLNQTASLNCTVFSSSDASIAWERNGERLVDNVSRTSIEPSQEMGTRGTYFFSMLNISDIVRGDNGIYRCLALDGAGNMTDSADFTIFVQEEPELAHPIYSKVLSMELQLVWEFTVQGNDNGIDCTANYRIQGTNETGPDVVGSTSPIVVKELEPYTTYEFQLICVNLVGSSDPLDFELQRTLAGIPSEPRNVRISEIEARQVFVQWDEPLHKNGPIDGYTLTARSENPDYSFSPFEWETSTYFTGLAPYTNYRIYLQATNFNLEEGLQTSIESLPSEVFQTLQAAPGKPAGLTVDDTPIECTIFWMPPSEPNGVITKYTLYEEVLKLDTDIVDKTQKMEIPATQYHTTFMKAGLDSFSIFRYSVTASTAPGEGVNATTTGTCETPQGVPVRPSPIPTPSAISQTSFTTTLQPYDARNGPISCCELIVVELQSVDAGLNLDPSDPSYLPDVIKSYEEAKGITGTPYRAVVFSKCPANGVIVIGATTDDVSTCDTGASAGSASRSRRETTRASTLSAVNGPLNPGGIYSTFVRVYTPSSEDPEIAFYESGPFMAPVTLSPGNGTHVTLTIVSVTVILVVICVIVIFICLRKRKRSLRQRNRSSPTASAGCTTTYCMCTDPLPLNPTTSTGNQHSDHGCHEYQPLNKKSNPINQIE